MAACFFLTRCQEVVDESIQLVIKKRQVKSQVRGLTEHDLFFREVSTELQSPSYHVYTGTCMGSP